MPLFVYEKPVDTKTLNEDQKLGYLLAYEEIIRELNSSAESNARFAQQIVLDYDKRSFIYAAYAEKQKEIKEKLEKIIEPLKTQLNCKKIEKEIMKSKNKLLSDKDYEGILWK